MQRYPESLHQPQSRVHVSVEDEDNVRSGVGGDLAGGGRAVAGETVQAGRAGKTGRSPEISSQ